MATPTKLVLEIVTPDKALLSEEVDEVVVPGSQGDFGVLPGHTPLLSTLRVGELWYRTGQEKHYLSVALGFVEVLPDRVTVLAQIGERARDIDVARAERAKQRAERRLTGQMSEEEFDIERARIALLKAIVRLQVAGKISSRA